VQKSLTLDFHPAQNHVGSLAGPLWFVWNNKTLFCNMTSFLTFETLEVDYFLDDLIECTRKTFLHSPQPFKSKQRCHHGFARDENPPSLTFAFGCTCLPLMFGM